MVLVRIHRLYFCLRATNQPLLKVEKNISLAQKEFIKFIFFEVDTWTVSFSPDSKFIATGTHSGKINIIGVESGKKESVLDTRGKFIMSIAYVS